MSRERLLLFSVSIFSWEIRFSETYCIQRIDSIWNVTIKLDATTSISNWRFKTMIHALKRFCSWIRSFQKSNFKPCSSRFFHHIICFAIAVLSWVHKEKKHLLSRTNFKITLPEKFFRMNKEKRKIIVEKMATVFFIFQDLGNRFLWENKHDNAEWPENYMVPVLYFSIQFEKWSDSSVQRNETFANMIDSYQSSKYSLFIS